MDPDKLKVVELHAELSAQGLDSRGVKFVLVDRLRQALEKETGQEIPETSILETSTEGVSLTDNTDKSEIDQEEGLSSEPEQAFSSEPEQALSSEPEQGLSSELEKEIEPEGKLEESYPEQSPVHQGLESSQEELEPSSELESETQLQSQTQFY